MVGSRPLGCPLGCRWPPLCGPLLVLVAAPVAAVGVWDCAVGRDAVHGVLLDQTLQVLGVDGLVLDQLGGELVQKLPVPYEQVFGGVVGLVDYAPYLLV